MDVLRLLASLVLDTSKYDKGLAEAEGGANKFATLVGTGMAGAATAMFTAAAAGVATVGAGVVTLTKQATDAYGQYEQLAGGIETLFGEAAPAVMEDAANAFSDAGMSMNQYMETSIQSAAALINSLEGDQAKAAELMNVSIIDMSDNVNKMGTTMEAVQNAYKVFSRGNFTMLDNLALGFSGTKQGMQELLDKAKEISGIEFDIESYSDIVQAIHVVQEEMGISGTTMKEAGSTITGSLGAVKAAWDNLITGIANEDADIGDLFDKLITSIFGQDGQGGFLSNMLPRIEQALKGVVELIRIGAERLPQVALEVLPDLITSFTEVITEIMSNLTQNSDEIINNLGDLFTLLIDSALNLIPTILESLPVILNIAFKLIIALANGLAQALPTLIPTIIDIVMMLFNVIMENLPLIIDAAVNIINALIEGIYGALPELSIAVTTIMWKMLTSILYLLPQFILAGVEIIETLLSSMIACTFEFLSGDFWNSALSAIVHSFTDIDWDTIGFNMIDGVVQGFKKGWEKLKETATNMVSSIKDIFTKGFDIHSPSRVFENYGEMIDEGLAIGIDAGKSVKAMKDMSTNITGAFTPSVAGAGGSGDIIIPVYLGNDLLQTVVVDALNQANFRSGGR